MYRGVHKLSVHCRQCTTQRLYQTKAVSVFGYNPSLHVQPDLTSLNNETENANVIRYLEAHRRYGYKYANLNPVPTSTANVDNPVELNPEQYGVNIQASY